MRILLLSLLTICVNFTFAQNFPRVYNILQANCTASGCHASISPQSGLDLSGSMTDVYNAIVNIDPTNVTASNKGDKLIKPGYPLNSYLYRKINSGLHADHGLTSGEGGNMPQGLPPIEDYEREIIKQWIYFGAPNQSNTTQVFNENSVQDYYTLGGAPRIAAPAPPAVGFQVHLGPIFLDASVETEYRLKHQLDLPANVEITQLEVTMNNESHHFILDKFPTAANASSVDEGMRNVNLANFIMGGAELVNAWQASGGRELPYGTAYFWAKDEYLDLNYHVNNYSTTQILPAEVYINVHTQPLGTAVKEMKAALVPNAASIATGPGATNTFSASSGFFGVQDDTAQLWMLASHTHKYGVDYDIYTIDGSGNDMDQIYEGKYDYDNNMPVTNYDWSHPPTRFWDGPNLYPIKASWGLRHEAKYTNTGSSAVDWGVTTNDEMMLYYIQYIEGAAKLPSDPTNVDDAKIIDVINFDLYPNPTNNSLRFDYYLPQSENVAITITDLNGKTVSSLINNYQTSGSHAYHYNVNELGLSAGMYFVVVNVGGLQQSTKLIVR